MPITDIKTYCKKNSIKIKKISINQTLATKLYFCSFNNCFLFPKLWTVITHDFFYFRNFDQFYSLKTKYSSLILNEKSIKKEAIHVRENKGLYFLLGCDNNYYHNLINFLPKLAAIIKFHNQKINIIINKNISLNIENFIIKHLENINIKNYCFFKVNWDEKIHRFEKIIFISKPNMSFSIKFYEFFYKNYYVNKKIKNFYILRGEVQNRKVINEGELIDYFKSINFSIIDCAKLTIFEQIKIFSSAKNIVMPSGAAMANMIFAPININFIEIRSNIDGEFSKEIQKYKKFNLIEFNFTLKRGNKLRKDIIVDLYKIKKLFKFFAKTAIVK